MPEETENTENKENKENIGDNNIEKKMEEVVIRKKHLHFRKKEERKWNTRYWKKDRKYCKRGRNCHKKQDKKMINDRKVKENNLEDETIYFIFIKETKRFI